MPTPLTEKSSTEAVSLSKFLNKKKSLCRGQLSRGETKKVIEIPFEWTFKKIRYLTRNGDDRPTHAVQRVRQDLDFGAHFLLLLRLVSLSQTRPEPHAAGDILRGTLGALALEARAEIVARRSAVAQSAARGHLPRFCERAFRQNDREL